MSEQHLTKEQLIEKQAELLNEMKAELERIAEAGLEQGAVIDKVGKYAILSTGTYARDNNYEIGQNVLFYPRTGQVVEAINHNLFIGELFVIDRVKEHYAEVNVKGDRKLVSKGKFHDLKGGDVVLLDRHHTIVQYIIEHARVAPQAETPVTWDMIGGNEEAKQLLIEAIELPYKYPELYKQYAQPVTKGILLLGPPGCGKTLMGRATATAIGAEGGFFSIKGPEVLDPYIGVAEANIRAIFARAKAYKEKHGRRGVIFIDEAEALLTARGTQYNFAGQTIVPTFLTEMEGIDDSGATVILSTNRDDMLDPAITREGRIDFKVEVKRPTVKEAKEIMAIHIHGKPVCKKHNREKLIEQATAGLYEHPLPHSGALIAGCVNKAVTHALRRDLANGHTKATGLQAADFAWATQQIIKQELKQHA